MEKVNFFVDNRGYRYYQTAVKWEKLKVSRFVTREPDEGYILRLVKSIRKIGLIAPLTCFKESDGKYQILDGQHRFLALKNIEEYYSGKVVIPIKVYVGLDDVQKQQLALEANEGRRRPKPGERFKTLTEIFEMIKKRLEKEKKPISEEIICNEMYYAKSKARIAEILIGRIVETLRKDNNSLLSTYKMIQNSQVPKRKIRDMLRHGTYPFITAQNLFFFLRHICRGIPISLEEIEENKNFREYEYENVRKLLDIMVEELVLKWLDLGPIGMDITISFFKRHPFDATGLIVREIFKRCGSHNTQAPAYTNEALDWKKITEYLLKFRNIQWTRPEISLERSVEKIYDFLYRQVF